MNFRSQPYLGNQFSSLQESLLNAGAESVLANLFPVNDQIASELLSHFYELLAQGQAKDKALQQAQQFIREKILTLKTGQDSF